MHFSNYLTRYLVPYLCTINQISSLQKHSNRLIILIKPLCHFLQVTSYYQKLFLSNTRWLCTISTYEALLLNFNPTFYIYIWIQIKWILQVCIVLPSLFQSLCLMKIVSETLQKFHIFCNAIHRGVRAGSAKKSGKKEINFKFFEKNIYTL